jgi:uncharacterized protein YndB with AHSA1/START domain
MSPDHEILNSRVVAFPPETVFASFSDPSRLAQWWGPDGFTNTFHEFDFRPGGVWKFTMHAPDGAAYAMDHRFVEVMPPERVEIRHIQPGHDFTLTVALVPEARGTRVTWRMFFDDPAEAEKLRPFLLNANEQNLDRLAAHLSGSDMPVR